MATLSVEVDDGSGLAVMSVESDMVWHVLDLDPYARDCIAGVVSRTGRLLYAYSGGRITCGQTGKNVYANCI